MMAWPTIVFGALLMMLGGTSYANAKPNEAGVVSPTALIPAAVGAVLAVCGVLAFNPKIRKHVMHAAAMVGLFGVVGGLVPVIRQVANSGEINPNAPAVRSGLLMTIVCVVFVGMCVKSFIDARRSRVLREEMGLGV